jgi:hypothetical protein
MAEEAAAEPPADLVVPAPYATFAHFVRTLDWLRTSGPLKVTEEALEAGPALRGSARTEVKNALLQLGLVGTDLRPSPELLGMARQEDEREPRLRNLAERCYPGPLGVLDAGGGRGEIERAFERCGRRGTTRERAIAFFLALSLAAGCDPLPQARPRRALREQANEPPPGVAPETVSNVDKRYAEALLAAVERMALEINMNDPAAFDRFEAICARFERARST